MAKPDAGGTFWRYHLIPRLAEIQAWALRGPRRRQNEDTRLDLLGGWFSEEADVGRKPQSAKARPKGLLTARVMVPGHQPPYNIVGISHLIDGFAEHPVRRSFLIPHIASDQDVARAPCPRRIRQPM